MRPSPSGSIGKTSDAYQETWSYNRVDSPHSDLLKPPFAYTRWNNYSFKRMSRMGWKGQFSLSPQLTNPRPPISDWENGLRVTNVVASYPSTISLLSKLVDKWKNSDVNVGVSLGESKESLGMVASSLNSLVQSARQLKRGNLGGAIAHFKNPIPRSSRRKAAKRLSQGDISGSWLALNLGWVPLVSDVYSALEYVRDDGGYAKVTSSWVKGTVSCSYPNFPPVQGKTLVAVCKSRYVCCVRTPPTEYDRLGLTNPAVVAWELVPWSFVVDYFLPIGDIINAMTALRIDTKDVFLEKRYDLVVQYDPLPKGSYISYNRWWAVSGLPPTRTRYWAYSRERVSIASQLVAGTLEVSVPTSLKRVANLAALFHQTLLSFKR